MSVTLTLTDVDPGGTQIYAFGTVHLSGNYPSGGDAVDWTQLVGQMGVRGETVESSMADPAYGPVQASFTVQGGTPNQYQMQQGAAANNWKMRGYTTGSSGAEFTGGSAYPIFGDERRDHVLGAVPQADVRLQVEQVQPVSSGPCDLKPHRLKHVPLRPATKARDSLTESN